MQIDLPTADQVTLAALATEAGYDSVEHYVTEYLVEFAQHHAVANLPPLSEQEIRASLAMCDQGMAEARAGKGKDFQEALGRIASKHGLNLER